MLRSRFLLLFCMLLPQGCAADPVSPVEPLWSDAEKATISAIAQGDYEAAVAEAMPLAERGDGDAEFWVGYLMLEWIADKDAKHPPTHDENDALIWIRRAASKGIPQAAATLRSGYQWGRYSLPKNSKLEACWRKVERHEEQPDVCLLAERSIKG